MRWFWLLALMTTTGTVYAAPSTDPAERELRALGRKVQGFRAVSLPRTGDLTLTARQSLTVDRLRGVALDDEPPQLGPLTQPYDPSQTDDFPAGKAPYVATGIGPFRFRYFNCELNYGGWHNMALQEYGATHGFNIIYPYVRTTAQRSRLPKGTKWLKWGNFVSWDEWMPKHQIPVGRYDLLVDRDLVAELTAERFMGDDNPGNWDYLMIDMEHWVHPPDELRKQSWYPANATEAEKQAFERKYYHGYALTYSAPMAAAKRLGYRNLSVYGWEPFPEQWYNLENLNFSPETYWRWAPFGREVYENPATDILNPCFYVFYWCPQNVAFTLCSLDYNRALVNTMPKRKPIRPYYWTLLHGGSADYHWWKDQPVPNEEARAWTLLCLMSGTDGFDLWNWSGIGSHHEPRPFRTKVDNEWKYNDIGLKDGFSVRAEDAADGQPPMQFNRYDFIHVVGVDEATGTVRFQKMDRYNWGAQYGLTPDQPIYAMKDNELAPHLRPESEPVAGVVEGMALAKPLEYLLSHGEVKVDVPSLDQYLKTLPIVRRVQLGKLHVLATYDPQVVHGQPAREIVLTDFAGHKGLTLRLPADAQTRLFVLREP